MSNGFYAANGKKGGENKIIKGSNCRTVGVVWRTMDSQ